MYRLKRLNFWWLKGHQFFAKLICQSHSPFLKEKAHVAVKNQKVQSLQHLKCMVHLKSSFKQAMKKWAGEASTLGKDPGVVAGFESPWLGRCSAQPCGPLVDSPAVVVSEMDDESCVDSFVV